MIAGKTVDKRAAQRLLLEALYDCGPGTTMNLQMAYCPEFPGSLWKRAHELVESGDAEWTNRMERNPSGRLARVLAITEQGLERLQ